VGHDVALWVTDTESEACSFRAGNANIEEFVAVSICCYNNDEDGVERAASSRPPCCTVCPWVPTHESDLDGARARPAEAQGFLLPPPGRSNRPAGFRRRSLPLLL
jgi:hypothetical protein